MLTWVEVVILLTSIGCMVVSAVRNKRSSVSGFLAQLRSKYGIKVDVETEIG